MTKKNVHKENLSIVQQVVDIVNKDNLLELEYEADDLKVLNQLKRENNLPTNILVQ